MILLNLFYTEKPIINITAIKWAKYVLLKKSY